jgi:large conductance mechanosensitive channel
MLGKVKSLWGEFVGFAFKGNMLDLAVGFVIGGAFSSVVKAMVEDIVMPVVKAITTTASSVGPTISYQDWQFHGILIGKFIGELLNFVILAAAVFFMIVKVVGFLSKSVQKPTVAAITTKECPYCLSVIPIKATKCAHCTSEVPATA